MKPNLDQGNPMAKKRNSPAPLAKQKRSNLAQTKPMAKAKNILAPHAKNREAQTYRKNPSSVAPRMSSDDGRILSELTTGKRSNSHNRGGR